MSHFLEHSAYLGPSCSISDSYGELSLSTSRNADVATYSMIISTNWKDSKCQWAKNLLIKATALAGTLQSNSVTQMYKTKTKTNLVFSKFLIQLFSKFAADSSMQKAKIDQQFHSTNSPKRVFWYRLPMHDKILYLE